MRWVKSIVSLVAVVTAAHLFGCIGAPDESETAESVAALGIAAPSAATVPDEKLEKPLGSLWTTLIETPAPQNPLEGEGDPCVDLGGDIVTPIPPASTHSVTCVVKPGTKIFVIVRTCECSTVEDPPFFGSNQSDLRSCVLLVDVGFTEREITVDGTPVPVTEVEHTKLLKFILPENNVLNPEQPAGTRGQAVAHGWGALVDFLAPGTHTITTHLEGTNVFGDHVDTTNTITIDVEP
jgi:hypothetical protein